MKVSRLILFCIVATFIFTEAGRNCYAQSVTATYTAGTGSTDREFTDVTFSSSCYLSLSVTIPANAEITGTDIEYAMTATGSGIRRDQISQLRCVSPNGANESFLAEGSGFTTGTNYYYRTNLNIANNVVGGGTINFQLHAGRALGGSGCGTSYNYVNNNWKITVHYIIHPDCSTTPYGGIISSSLTTGCVGITTLIHLSAIGYSDDLTGLTYRWQRSSDGLTSWTNIAGATNPESAEYASSSAVFFRLAVTCQNTGETSYSNIVSYTTAACNSYNIGSQSSIVYTCNAMFYDSGGNTGSYSNSEEKNIKFCSGNGQHLKCEFLSFEAEDNGDYGRYQERYDKLKVFDGPGLSSFPLYELSGLQTSTNMVPIIISSGECLSFLFTSDGSLVKPGWTAHISCTNDESNIASQFCITAPNICNLNGYQGSTSNFYNVERVYGQIEDAGPLFPGSSALDNNSFITFVAAASQVIIEMEISNCNGGFSDPGGVQFAVYSGDNCHLESLVSNPMYIDPGLHEGIHNLVISNLIAGDTYYLMTDGNFGAICDYSIKAQSGVELAMVNPNQVILCEGQSSLITASGGTNYVWTGPNGFHSTDAAIYVSQEGLYTVVITGGNAACPSEVVLSSVVDVISDFTAPIFNLQTSYCYGATIPPLPTISSNGVSGTWSPALNNTATTNYYFTANNMCADPYSVQIKISPDLTTSFSKPDCFGQNGSLTFSSGSENLPLSFTVNGVTAVSPLAVPAGNHLVRVTDSNGCYQSKSVSISQPNELKLDYELTDSSCYNNINADVKMLATGGTEPYYFTLLDGELNFDGEEHFDLTKTEYTLLTRDSKNCAVQKVLYIYVPAEIMTDYVFSNPTCIGNDNGYIEVAVSGGTEPYRFYCGNFISETSLISNLEEGVWDVEIVDTNGCSAVIHSISLTDIEAECLSTPNAFTPNNDGTNDIWIIENLHIYKEAQILVFNRWGQIIFDGNCTEKWNGKYNDKLVPSGPYLYSLILNDGTKPQMGIVTVVY